jgi:hypothetical protein
MLSSIEPQSIMLVFRSMAANTFFLKQRFDLCFEVDVGLFFCVVGKRGVTELQRAKYDADCDPAEIRMA